MEPRAAPVLLLADPGRMANTLAIESQTSDSTDAITAPLSTRMSKLTGTLLGDSTATVLATEAQPMERKTSKTLNGHHAVRCL